MEAIAPGQKLRQLLEKYKYALLILAVGILLMLLPSGTEPEPADSPEETTAEGETMERHLQQLLSRIDGAGEVEVLLSEQQGSQTIYQTDQQTDTDGAGASEQVQTVIVTDSDRNENGLVRRTDPPKYLGAVIVCQGADRAEVRLAIVEAVQCATGLGANQICVVKMK